MIVLGTEFICLSQLTGIGEAGFQILCRESILIQGTPAIQLAFCAILERKEANEIGYTRRRTASR